MPSLPTRLASIDVFRALTMFLMIFVNDLWTLRDIPQWLEHTKAAEDGMGLADTVFPAFLFIVGLSIPFAIGGRLAKGVPQPKIITHILTRSIALLIMGLLHVNLENYNSAAAILPKSAWEILLTIGFFLIWLDYPKSWTKQRKMIFQGAGILLLVILATLYRGGDSAGHPSWIKTYWWGILGLIGWSYLLCSLIFLFTKGKLPLLISALILLLLYNIASTAGWLNFLEPAISYIWIIGEGSTGSLTMAGIVAALIYTTLAEKGKHSQYAIILICFALLMLAGGFVLRPFWGISKIRATPSWVMICSGISILFFLLMIWLVDIKNKEKWFTIIRPAGTSTLTAYLLPYIHYPIYSIIGISLPLALRTGGIGIIKSLIYALLIILITGVLEKWRIRLKI